MIDADPIATAVRAVMTTRTTWKGTASDLLSALAEVAGERTVKAKTWPDSPRSLAGRLRRAATFLRKVGIESGFAREGRGRTRTIYLTIIPNAPTPENGGTQPSASSATSIFPPKPTPASEFGTGSLRTVTNDTDGGDSGDDRTVRANLLGD